MCGVIVHLEIFYYIYKIVLIKIRIMRKVFLFLMVILFCGCEGAAYLDITVKNNSDISIYVNGDATDTMLLPSIQPRISHIKLS